MRDEDKTKAELIEESRTPRETRGTSPTERFWEKESGYRTLFETAVDAIVVADIDPPMVRFANQSFCDLFGYRQEEIVGLSHEDLHPPEELAKVARIFQAHVHGELDRATDLVCLRKDGSRFYADIAGNLATFDGQPHSVASFRDITERKENERAIAHEKARAQQYLDVAEVMLIALDSEQRVTLLNPAGCDVLGYEAEEILGRNWFDTCIPEQDVAQIKEVFDSIIRGDLEPVRYYENNVVRKDGRQRLIAWHNSVLRDDGGEIVGLFSSGQDITEQKEIEWKLAQSDRLASLGMLAAGVAHEINNPLSYILYNLESVGEDLPELLLAIREYQSRMTAHLGADVVAQIAGDASEKMNPAVLEDIRVRIDDALTGTYRIRDVTRSLGTFSRVERDELAPVNLMHVFDLAANMAANEVRYRAHIVKDYDRKAPEVLASEGRLCQVFLNLIINAAHAIDEGDSDGNEIRLRTWTEDGHVCAQVRDTGDGISPDNLSQLFEPFFTTKSIGVGSGLGLAISKNIIESYGGLIEVESTVGEGTCVTIQLPIRAEETTPSEDSAEPASEPNPGGRILVVDDEVGIRRAMKRLLRDHETILAENGAEAIEIIQRDQAFDLILCDVMMPEISGMDLHQWLADAYPVLAERFIFITGGTFTPRAREYLNSVDNLRLEKPLDVANFKKIVADHVRLVKANDKLIAQEPREREQ